MLKKEGKMIYEGYCFKRLSEIFPQDIPCLSHPLRPYPNNGPSKDDGFGSEINIMLFVYKTFCREWDLIEIYGPAISPC